MPVYSYTMASILSAVFVAVVLLHPATAKMMKDEGDAMKMEKMDSASSSSGVQFHDYCVIGAGPAGLQLGYLMEKAGRDYIIYERNNVSGSFFVKFPRHRKLISINKVYTGRVNRYFNERHDWNSLLTDDDSLLFQHYSKEFFPPTDPLLSYLDEYRRRFGIKVQFDTKVQNMRRVKPGERTDGYNFVMNDQRGNFMLCKVAIAATGMGKANHINFKGSEYVEDYSDFDVDPAKYEGKTVLILGRGNSAFETADAIYPVANTVHMVSRSRVRLSWNTHYVGDTRGLNNNILDTYQLKSLDGLLEFDVSRLGLMKRNGKLYASVMWGDEYNDTSVYPRVKPENEDNFANFPFRIPYDHVISCLGWRFDGSFLHQDTQQVPHGKVAKYPAIRYDYQSWVTRDLYFAGTNSHSLDWRKSAGGFIHGFRYTARALHRILEYRYHGVPWPSQTFENTQMLNVLIKRLNEAPGTYQMVSFLGDVVVIKGNTFTLIEEFPVKLLPHFSEITGHTGSKFFVIINEYGPGFSGPDVDTLGPDRASTGGAMEAHKSNFLHPVFYYYEGRLPTEKQFKDLPNSNWKFVLPRPKKVHHVVEDFLSMWTASTVHILPLRRFLDDVLGQDMRLYFNIHCFELGLNFANVPAGCKSYLEGKGLSLSTNDAVDIVNYLHGTTKRKTPMDEKYPKCDLEDHPLNHNNLNRTDLLHRRLKNIYPSTSLKTQFPHDFVSDEEELEGFRFIYEDTVPEALLEDDEVRSLWRWSRSVIARQSVEYPFVTLTEANFDSVIASHTHGIINFGLHFDPVTRSVEEMLNYLAAEFGQMPSDGMTKKPLIANLDCYDWPRICEKLMLKEYPTVKLLHRGELKSYTGPFEKQALKTAVKLSGMDFPMRLDSLQEVDQFLADSQLASLGVESAVVLSMPQMYSADAASFSFLDSHFGKTPVAVCCNSSAAHDAVYQKYGRHLKLMHPRKEEWGVVAHATDSYVPYTTRSYTLPPYSSIPKFLDEVTLPIFGEVDWRTLPAYYKSGKELIMLFGTETQRRISGQLLADLALRSKDRNVKFVYVNSETPGVYVYTRDGGHVVALSQRENLAYWYSGDTSSMEELSAWLGQYKMKTLEPAAERPHVDWPPAAKSYDFLALIDAEEAVKHKHEEMARQVVRLSQEMLGGETTQSQASNNATATNKTGSAAKGITASGQYAADIQQATGTASVLGKDTCLRGQCEDERVAYGTYSHKQPAF